MGHSARLGDDEHERCRLATKVDLHDFRLRTTKAHHAKISEGLVHVESIHERALFVRARRRSRSCFGRGRPVLRLFLPPTTRALHRDDQRHDRNAERRNASFHDQPHVSDSFLPRFASDISSRDSYRPVIAFDASCTTRHGRIPKLTA